MKSIWKELKNIEELNKKNEQEIKKNKGDLKEMKNKKLMIQ